MKQGQFNANFLTRKSSLASSRSGQALIEYVLLLFVTISLIMTARFLMMGMASFMEGYMGKYVRCLMDYGELPTRGIDIDALKKNESGSYICAKQFSFNVQTGFQPNGSGSGSLGDGGSGSGSSSNSKSNGSSSKSGSGSDSDASSSDGTSSDSSASDIASRERSRRSRGSSGGDSSSSSSEARIAKAGRLSSADGEDDVLPTSSRVIADAASKGEGAVADSETARSGRARYRAISGAMAESIEKNSKKAQTNSKSKPGAPTILSEDESATLGPRKSAVAMYQAKPQVQEEEQYSPFSVGNIFKYVIIIALVIMIVIFFGGQLLNYSNSDN